VRHVHRCPPILAVTIRERGSSTSSNRGAIPHGLDTSSAVTTDLSPPVTQYSRQPPYLFIGVLRSIIGDGPRETEVRTLDLAYWITSQPPHNTFYWKVC